MASEAFKIPGGACQTPLALHADACIHAQQHPCNPSSETPGYGPEYIGCVATYGSKADILPAAGHPSQAPVVGFVPVAVVEPKVVFAHCQLKQQRHHRKPKALHSRRQTLQRTGTASATSLILRPLPDIISQLWEKIVSPPLRDKIWE